MSMVFEGLPTQRDERWKYTSLRALGARAFADAAETPRVHPAALSDIPPPRLVLVNGVFDAALSQLGSLQAGLSVGRFSGEARGMRYDAPHEAFARINLERASDGAAIQVDAGVKVAQPLHLVFIGAPSSADLASHSRHAVALGENSQLSLVEHHQCTGTHRHLQNHFFSVSLGAGATLVHARLQDDDAGATIVERTDARVATDATYHRLDLELGANLSRNEVNVELLGDRAQVLSSGALLAGDRRHVDTRLDIAHVARDTRCDLLWRGLAADRGRVAFHGGITIRAGADGSDARLSNKNLLLSENAEINTQPVLQIYADEVKAAHGATVGRLDPTALFYLRSRGIPSAEARALLTLAFCREALASIGDPALVEALSPRLEARLATLETSQVAGA